MFKKTAIISIFLALVVLLSACASSTTSASSTSANTASQSQQITPSSLTLQNKLGLGILKLEGTGLAVTADQANTLLPLWKAVKSLNSSNTTSAVEMSALYQQIEDGLSSDQVQAIKKLSLTQAQLTYMIQQQSTVTSSSSSSSSSSAASGAQSQAGGPGMDVGGMPGGSSDIAAITGQTSSTTVKTSTVKSSVSSVSQLNVVFANSVVTLLQKRIS